MKSTFCAVWDFGWYVREAPLSWPQATAGYYGGEYISATSPIGVVRYIHRVGGRARGTNGLVPTYFKRAGYHGAAAASVR